MGGDYPSSAESISSSGIAFVVVNAVFTVLVSLAVGVRQWSRRLNKAGHGWDDWCILAALLVFYGQTVLNYWVVIDGGLGFHATELPAYKVDNVLLRLTISQFLYAVLFMLIRFSGCFLLLRIFIQQWLQYCVRLAMALNIAWGIFVIVSALAVCKPFAYNYNHSIPGGYCHYDAKLYMFVVNAIWTILLDCYILGLPQAIVWQLKMPLAEKAGLSMIFTLGIFDVIISIVRITAVVGVNSADITNADPLSQIWTIIELSVGIIVACLPVCRTALEHVLPLWLLPRSRRHPQSPGSSGSGAAVAGNNDGNKNGSSANRSNYQHRAVDNYHVLDEETELPTYRSGTKGNKGGTGSDGGFIGTSTTGGLWEQGKGKGREGRAPLGNSTVVTHGDPEECAAMRRKLGLDVEGKIAVKVETTVEYDP